MRWEVKLIGGNANSSRAGFRKAAKPDGDEMIEHQLQAMHQESRDLDGDPATNTSTNDHPPTPSSPHRPSQSRSEDTDLKANELTWARYTPMSERGAKVFLPSLNRDWNRYETSDSSARSSQQQSKRSDEIQAADHTPQEQRAFEMLKALPP